VTADGVDRTPIARASAIHSVAKIEILPATVVTTPYPNKRTRSVTAYLLPSPDRSRSAFV
jgi:hypothetical protein